MDKVTQQNAAASEESASASESLSGQAVRLRDTLQQLLQLVGRQSSAKVDVHAPMEEAQAARAGHPRGLFKPARSERSPTLAAG
jgi:hypothetical protein